MTDPDRRTSSRAWGPARLRPDGRQTRVPPDLDVAIAALGLRGGAAVSFHRHLRDGDAVLAVVIDTAARAGLRDLHVAVSSIVPDHAPLVQPMQSGVVIGPCTDFLSGSVADGMTAAS